MSDTPRTIAEAEALGYTVDTHCYPHLAYIGPRFMPNAYCLAETARETEFRKRAEKAESELAAARRETAERVREACAKVAGQGCFPNQISRDWCVQDIRNLDLSPFTGEGK